MINPVIYFEEMDKMPGLSSLRIEQQFKEYK